MALRTFLLPLAASPWTNRTNRRDRGRGLEIFPEDTLEEAPYDARNDVVNNVDVLNEEEADYIEEDATEDPHDHSHVTHHRRFSSFTSFSKSLLSMDTPTWFQKIKYFVFPPKEDIESFIPNYRYIPILSGLLMPFSLLLEIPGLTQLWYIRTENNEIVERRLNPAILDVGIGISFACAVIANVCLIMRFLEKRVKTMTILCAVFLTIHDIINVVAVTVFGVKHRFNDGFTYGQSFWMTVCSTIASCFTTATLLWDLYRTPDFNQSGSGLTRRQRTLVIIIMVLFCYACFGALINSLLLNLSFINGLYFTIVSIETIGFGDIVPKTTGARVWVCGYSTVGVINLGVAIGMSRETVLEAMEVAYRRKARNVMERLKEGRKRRHVVAHWRRGIEWRLKEMGVPVWIPDESHEQGAGEGKSTKRTGQKGSGFIMINKAAEWAGFADTKVGDTNILQGPNGMRLNVNALTRAELEACALEAGVPLDTLLPSDFISVAEETATLHVDADVESNSSTPPGWIRHPLAPHFENAFRPTEARTLTHAKVGGMSALLTRVAVADVHKNATSVEEPPALLDNRTSDAVLLGETSKNLPTDPSSKIEIEKGVSTFLFNPTDGHTSDKLGRQMMQDLDAKVFYSKLIIAWSLFFIFWTIGSAIFSATEGWSYGVSMYFCFIAFSSLGYGDYSPQTPAGRSVFVVWAILGVGTMTILVSVVQEAYSSRYKNAVHIRAFNKAVKRYRQRVQRVGSASGRRDHHLRLRSSILDRADPSSLLQEKARPELHSPPVFSFPQAHAGPNKISESRAPALEALEALPSHVLHHAKTFRTYLRLFVNEGNHARSQGFGGGMTEVSGNLRKLLDEIALSGSLGMATKEEILQDRDARHTLFVLSIEKALQKMIDAAQDAMEAVQERKLTEQRTNATATA